MASIFTRIIDGELPGRFVYRDDRCVAFLTIAPLAPGHTLVVPIAEVDHWIDLDPELAAHLMIVAQKVGRAIEHVYRPRKVGMTILGLEVPHAHIHVSAIETEHDLEFSRVDHDPDPAALDDAAERLRAAIAG